MTFQIDLIQSSFKDVAAQGPAFVARFYEIVWDRYPELAKLFKEEDITQQRTAFLSMFTYCVDNLHHVDTLKQILHELGAQHSHYGIQNEHYAQFGECFLMTLSEYFYHNWTEELSDQWTQAFALIANFMQEGSASTLTNQSHSQEPSTHTKDNSAMNTEALSNNTTEGLTTKTNTQSDTLATENDTKQNTETHTLAVVNQASTIEETPQEKPLSNKEKSTEENSAVETQSAVETTHIDESTPSTTPTGQTVNAATITEGTNITETTNTEQQSLSQEQNMQESTVTKTPEDSPNHKDLLDLIRQKAQEQAKKEVQALWEKAFEEAVHQELAELVSQNTAA